MPIFALMHLSCGCSHSSATSKCLDDKHNFIMFWQLNISWLFVWQFYVGFCLCAIQCATCRSICGTRLECLSGPGDDVGAELQDDVAGGPATDGHVKVDLRVAHCVWVGDRSDCGIVNGVKGWRGRFMRQNSVHLKDTPWDTERQHVMSSTL